MLWKKKKAEWGSKKWWVAFLWIGWSEGPLWRDVIRTKISMKWGDHPWGNLWKNFLDSGNSKYKGLKIGASLAWWRNSKEAHVAGGEREEKSSEMRSKAAKKPGHVRSQGKMFHKCTCQAVYIVWPICVNIKGLCCTHNYWSPYHSSKTFRMGVFGKLITFFVLLFRKIIYAYTI